MEWNFYYFYFLDGRVSVPMKWYDILNKTVNGNLLQYYIIYFVVNRHVYDPGQSLINDNFTVVTG